MPTIRTLLETWSSMLALPKPKILPARSLSASFYERKGRSHVIHVRQSLSSTELAFHELGHFFLEVHFGSLIPARSFTSLFGDRDEAYDSPLLNVPGARKLPAKYYGFLNRYAETHPEEDWAECFAAVMMHIHEDEDLPDYEDEELQKKLEYVQKMVQKALKKGGG
jgi:hypothetical protein